MSATEPGLDSNRSPNFYLCSDLSAAALTGLGIRGRDRSPVFLFRPLLSSRTHGHLVGAVTPGWADPDPDQQQHPDGWLARSLR